ncbi:MAG: terpene cyclase/mutase family protein [Planctomycetales bacterium]|nr:terpene cyclase/mutase family protein [Planctomycetales bacterium]
MSTVESNSSFELVFEEIPPAERSLASRQATSLAALRYGSASGELNGEVFTLPCPTCRSPMSVRLWLMTADCWCCQQSIDLTLEQEAEIRRQLAQQAAVKSPPATPQPKPAAPASPKKPVASAPAAPPPAAKPAAPPAPKSAPQPAAKPTPEKAKVTRPAPPKPTAPPAASPPPPRTMTYFPEETPRGSYPLKDLPAWIVSAVFHAVLIILLGLWTLENEEYEPKIVLSVNFSEKHRTGGDKSEEEFNQTEFELPIDKVPENKQQREAMIKANQDARELRLVDGEQERHLPPIDRVRADLKSADPTRRMLAARDPRVRAEIVRSEGGTTATEAAVSRALRWVARQQTDDGSWSLRGPYADGGGLESKTAATSMALMTLLGTGQSHRIGIYRDQVAAGLSWLVKNQKPNGDLSAGSGGNSTMYAHALATLVLCDAFKITGDGTLRGPAQKAVDFIVEAQHTAGGWRYRPGEAGDTSVVGWQLMALHSAHSAYVRFPERTLPMASDYLDSVQSRSGGQFSYMPKQGPTPTMTAAGLLSRMYLGWNKNDEALGEGIAFLHQHHLPGSGGHDIYYWYYATQVMHHWGGAPWEDWNREIKKVLLATQEGGGPEAGSWPTSLDARHGKQGGRLYTTALSTCTLEVYYRYAPLYWQIELD